jgi:hypothetical protein
VRRMTPMVCRCGPPSIEYQIQLWGADGVLWAEASHEDAESVRDIIRRYAKHAAKDEGNVQ